MNWILGSSSPRRSELLALLGKPFTVVKPRTLEQQNPGESPEGYAYRNAREKALDVIEQTKGIDQRLVICADTIVVVDGKVLEKPLDADDAARMLTSLSGREHLVLTGLAVCRSSNDKILEKTQVISTRVCFKNLTQTEILHYVRSGEPMDKAGAYGAQGLGACFVQSIQGSYTNVVGLPMAELTEVLGKTFHCYP